jgi:hypothetical protein
LKSITLDLGGLFERDQRFLNFNMLLTCFEVKIKDGECLAWGEEDTMDSIFDLFSAYTGREGSRQTCPTSTYRSHENDTTLLSLPLLNISYSVIDIQQNTLSEEMNEKTLVPCHTLRVGISDLLLSLPPSQKFNSSILYTLTQFAKIFTYDNAEIIRTGQERYT